jgi:predicted glycogen debranching enzyme
VALANTRRYHAFLMCSLAPPVQRTLLVAKVDLCVEYRGETVELSANEFVGGTVSPQGFVHLESFAVLEGLPTWRYAIADALLEQRIFMAPGENTSYLRLELLRGAAPMRVTLKPFVTYRDYHSHSRGAAPFRVDTEETRCSIRAFEGARPYHLSVSQGRFTPTPTWYWNFWHRAEAQRGLDAVEDLLLPGTFSADLALRTPVFLTASAESAPPRMPVSSTAGATIAAPRAGAEVLAELAEKNQRLLAPLPESAPQWIRSLALASDQFIVRRGEAKAGTFSIIAGYPWFADWGRDTMISLPGLTTLLERFDVAAAILKTYASYIDAGMLPNRFPDGGEAPEYDTADATLWMFHALDDYLNAHPDPPLLHALFPKLMTVIRAHVDGTRHGIHMDGADGLLHVGDADSSVTWMDAREDGHALTPRAGKPVEINALWLNALDVGARLAAQVGDDNAQSYCASLLKRACDNFGRFWNEERGCLFDVIDTDTSIGASTSSGASTSTSTGTGINTTITGNTFTGIDRARHGVAPNIRTRDQRLRPNQILAVSLPFCTLSTQQMRAVVDACARELLCSYGLRTLSTTDPGYLGRCDGDQRQRDAAYHMGTAWAWLLGPLARAHYRAYGDPIAAQALLEPMAQHVQSACIGTVSEIFDGDAPHTARGCFAQAWSVAEILRAWIHLEAEIDRE